MKATDYLKTSLVYIFMASLVFFIFRKVDDVSAYSQLTGYLAGIGVAAGLYQSKNKEPASSKLKISIGFLLAFLTIVHGLVFQQLFNWMEYPDIEIGIPVIGQILLSSIFWNIFTTRRTAPEKK